MIPEPTSTTNSNLKAICPSNVAATQKVRNVKISPNTKQIIYQVVPFYKGPERMTSEIWLADTDIAGSARRLTDGLFNDRAAVFHPDGNSVIFVSDRTQPGKAKDLYQLCLSNAEGARDPRILNFERSVQEFEISPDGQYIAYSSIRHSFAESTACDAKVYGFQKTPLGLWIYSFITGESRLVDGIDGACHIESFTWSSDGFELLYRLRKGKEAEYSEQEILVQRISVTPGSRPVTLGTYPRSPSGSNIWLGSGHIVGLQSYEPGNSLDARALFIHEISSGKPKATKRLYGDFEDAVRIVDMQSKYCSNRHVGSGMIAVEVCSDVDTHIDAVYLHRNNSTPKDNYLFAVLPLFRTQGDAIWFGAWDAKYAHDSATGKTTVVVAAVLSSGILNEPPNVWSIRIDENMETKGTPPSRAVTSDDRLDYDVLKWYYPSLTSVRYKLSSHLDWLKNCAPLRTEVIHWQAEDGTRLSGVVRSSKSAVNRPLPTVLFIHGGPYRRDIPDYMPYFCNWRELLASAGYLVVSPNYRGSQGRGHAFAFAANQGIGVYDWPDCESMVDEVIRRGWADPTRLAVAGWSHGGSLTAWGVTLTKDRFKAAVVGAGASNWEGMVMESGSPELEKAIGQRDPWDGELYKRNLSPIHRVDGVSTAVLILHGDKDERVPVGQAIGLYRGLQRKANARGKRGTELVIYPREPHGFLERGHAENVMERVIRHFDKWL
ncbi:Alpha/Beta hydrolase protein [Lentinula lateritia]|uniref:Dipeptidyl-peptidase V n=1 Tax=Lentinula lateritia TaxID=40482 RepID=A0ABQ8UXH9_9AGAR|nr:Alpha/Beta hydrolase protein [Lentinula lateritia]